MTVKNKTKIKDKEQRALVQKQIKRAKKEWERIVDCLPEPIALLSKEHRVVRLNKAMADIMGVSPREAVGQVHCLFKEAEGNHDGSCPHARLLEDEKSHISEIYIERLDSHFEIRAIPDINPKDKSLIGSVFLARDITEIKNAEKEKQQLQAQLLNAQKLEAVGQLAAGVAHEINTPAQFVGTNIDFMDDSFQDIKELMNALQQLIATVKSGASPIEQAADAEKTVQETDWDYLAEEIPEAIRQSRDGVQRITSIVTAMKEFSRPGSHEKVPDNLNAIIQTTVTVTRNEWRHLAEVELDLDESLPNVPCLHDELGQVILDMIVNAAHAIAAKLGDNPEGAKGTIRICTRCGDNKAEIQIEDNGTGIPPEVLQKIFDPFFTTKEVGKGIGQGLAISHDVIVGKHGGSIEVTSTLGEGTIFSILLPLVEP